MKMSISMNTLEAILRAFNNHDIDSIMSYFSPRGEFVMAAGPGGYGTRLVGRAAIAKALKERFEVVPDISWTDASSWICGDRAVTEWRVQGTTPTGPLDCNGCDLWHFDGDKILRKDTYYKQVINV